MLLNETDIREKIVFPWLKAIGIDLNSIVVEKSFTIRLGHGVYNVKSEQLVDKAGGRADYLIKNASGKNLFIVETKTPNHQLTEEDRDQAISYARLIDDGNIPPFALVTNGLSTKLYDTITKYEITNKKSLIKHPHIIADFEISCDIELQAQALEKLITLNPSNLLAFCMAQVDTRMRILKSDDIYSGKKYIPSLYQERIKEFQQIKKILLNEEQSLEFKGVALLLGQPQSGKTAFLCNTAQQYLSENIPCLFYPAIGLTKGLLQAIQEDFQWTFWGDKSASQCARQLNSIACCLQKPLILIIDGLNELDQKLAYLISNEAQRLISNNLRILLSLTSSSVENILFEFSNPVYFAESANISKKDARVLRTRPLNEQKGRSLVQLEGFNQSEYKSLLLKYKTAYKVHIQDGIPDILQNPFYLRVAMEFFSGRTLPNKIDIEELIQEILLEKSARVGIGEVHLVSLLQRITKFMIINGAPITDLDDLSIDPLSLRKLCEAFILCEVHDGISTGFDFYYSRERDFAIAHYCGNWKQKLLGDSNSVIPIIKEAFKSIEGQGALIWFLSYSSYLEQFKNVYNVLHENFEYFELLTSALLNQKFEKVEDLQWLNTVFLHTSQWENKEKSSILLYKLLLNESIIDKNLTDKQSFLLRNLLFLEANIKEDVEESFSYKIVEKFSLLSCLEYYIIENDNIDLCEFCAELIEYIDAEIFIELINNFIDNYKQKFISKKESFVQALMTFTHKLVQSDMFCPSMDYSECDVNELLCCLNEQQISYGKIIKYYSNYNFAHQLAVETQVIVEQLFKIIDLPLSRELLVKFADYPQLLERFTEQGGVIYNDPFQLFIPFDVESIDRNAVIELQYVELSKILL